MIRQDRTGVQKPGSRIVVTIPYPVEDCSSTASLDWICSKCGFHLEYCRKDRHLYCDCGRCDYRYWDFRCPDPKHGHGFSSYKESRLLSLLDKLKPFKECNILILGRTGVGKSTWINSLANYLTYPTLDSALKADSLSYIIRFAFTTYSTNDEGEYEPVRVQAGFDSQSEHLPGAHTTGMDEQDGSNGQSATQRTSVHRLHIGEYEIRLIDTLGIGDTRGVSRDKENMADILSVLQSYPDLHGILILLKPNEQILDLMFKFCMQELLTHLHRDAAKNIAFGFTNTRGTNYRPGDSFGPLHQLLQKFSTLILLFVSTTSTASTLKVSVIWPHVNWSARSSAHRRKIAAVGRIQWTSP
jgi:GTPase SAR1 family protein